ncbi:putative biotin--[acetyl-CoA-carboxylase] ligase, partial [Ancylostoma caninum]
FSSVKIARKLSFCSFLDFFLIFRTSGTEFTYFNLPLYFSRLRTRHLGRVILHIPVATTTMNVCASLCDAIPTCDGAVVVARQQTHGQGRGGNEFVSPIGAAMFTVSTALPQSCSLAKTPSFLQHVFAVAVVDGVRRLSGLEDFPLRIKWPNDFYFNRSHKVGGLLATAKCRDDGLLISIGLCRLAVRSQIFTRSLFHLQIPSGAGINVSNPQPTVCLNDMVPDGSDVKFNVEEVIAETLNRFECKLDAVEVHVFKISTVFLTDWMNMYEIKGPGEVLKAYYEFWLHSREEVLLEELGEKVVIRGLDKNGYLQVRSKSNPSKIFSVGDNGNTFDMMKGLIRHKVR